MSVSERIIKRREELKLTQTELARRAGLKPPAISQYESGARSPSYEALIKLSNALDVTTDYLISGSNIKADTISEGTAKILINIIQKMSVEDRERLLQYAAFLINAQTVDFGIPTLNGYFEYANYIFKNYSNGKLPVDVHEIAASLGISVYKDDLKNEYEGTIIKNAEKCVAILDEGISFDQRIKFTLAMLIGHAVLPWHLRSNYFIRKKGKSTLHEEDTIKIEAQKFAACLLMPDISFAKDLGKDGLSIKLVKEIAKDKYDVSVTAFLNRLVDFDGNKYFQIQSNKGEILKTYSGKRPIVDKINENSKAYSFYVGAMPQQEEIREVDVPANYWFQDAEDGETVFESSVFNPTYGNVLTLITSKKCIYTKEKP